MPQRSLDRLTPDEIARLAALLASRHVPGSEAQRRFQAIRDEWYEIMPPEVEAIRASGRLTANDMAIVINV